MPLSDERTWSEEQGQEFMLWQREGWGSSVGLGCACSKQQVNAIVSKQNFTLYIILPKLNCLPFFQSLLPLGDPLPIVLHHCQLLLPRGHTQWEGWVASYASNKRHRGSEYKQNSRFNFFWQKQNFLPFDSLSASPRLSCTIVTAGTRIILHSVLHSLREREDHRKRNTIVRKSYKVGAP
jgi:hypothetical protein